MRKHVKYFHWCFLTILLENLAYSFSSFDRLSISLGCINTKSNLVKPILTCNQTLLQFLNEGSKCHVCVVQHDLDTAMVGFGKIYCGRFIIQYCQMKIPYCKFKVTIFIATFLAQVWIPITLSQSRSRRERGFGVGTARD